jgi:hypothetical protein
MALDKESAVSVRKASDRGGSNPLPDALHADKETEDRALDAVTDFAEQSATQVSRLLDYSFRVSQEATKQATQNLDELMQCGSIIAGGWQAILREWVSATQETTQRNMSDLEELMQCRTVDAFLSRQSSILRDRVEVIQNSSARISEVSAQVASDTAKRINELSSSINFSGALLNDAQGSLRKAGEEMARVDRAAD